MGAGYAMGSGSDEVECLGSGRLDCGTGPRKRGAMSEDSKDEIVTGGAPVPAVTTSTAAVTVAEPAVSTSAPVGPLTLAIDIGGTGLKASVLDANGAMVADRVVVKTTYPCSPAKLVEELAALVAPLPPADRVSAGFPGM